MSFIEVYNLAKLKNSKDAPKIARVICIDDPKGIGRIKVSLPGIFDPEDEEGSNLPWIRRMGSEMSIGLEELNIPALNDNVEIIWPYDEKHAFYRGIPSGDSRYLGYFTEHNWGWGMPCGFAFLVNRDTGAFRLRNNECTINVAENGEITITTTSNTNIKTEGNAKIETEGTTTIEKKGNVDITVKSRASSTVDGNIEKTTKGNFLIDSVTTQSKSSSGVIFNTPDVESTGNLHAGTGASGVVLAGSNLLTFIDGILVSIT